MDKFVIKRPRTESSSSKQSPPKKKARQATIESLKGVVVVEDIERHKAVLKSKDQSAETLLATLVQLQKKIPSRAVLKSTKIGHTVNKLTKHSSPEVSAKAAEIVNSWKEHYQAKLDKPMLEVKCDKKTEKMRNSARGFIAEALELPAMHHLPEQIEREAFCQCGRLVQNPYRRTMRTLVFTLKHQAEVKDKVLKGSLSAEELVKQHRKQS